MKSGLYLVHKPVGPSSASLVRTFQSRIKDAGLDLAVGHGGTLDPFASGLLVIMVGQATRLMELFHALPKGSRVPPCPTARSSPASLILL
ncbi:MAG: hypothetical protein ACKOB3_01905 [Holophagaceae bacterium]